jgi:hypothetical protein
VSLGQSGPPATPKQLQYLQSLLAKAGYDTWREARRPLGLTQRQGSGKFTRREASELIDRLVADEPGFTGDPSVVAAVDPGVAATPVDVELDNSRHEMARGLPADILAAELERRGWTVTPPPS